LPRLSNQAGEKGSILPDGDLEFVRACQKGDLNAFDVLVVRHQRKMFNVAYRMLGNYDDAADVTQEAFVAAYKAIGTFKTEAKFSTWLYSITVNHAKNRLKQTRGRKEHERLSPAETENLELESCPRSDENPYAIMEQKEKDALVHQCIASLDDEYREVLILRDIQGLSYEEIRGILNIPEGTVKSRLARAREALKNGLLKVFGDL